MSAAVFAFHRGLASVKSSFWSPASGLSTAVRLLSAQSGASSGDSAAEQRLALLETALKHVKELGWSQAALVEGARDLGLSPAAAGLAGGGEADLVAHFLQRCNASLAAELEGKREELGAMRVRERVGTGIKLRLAMNIPFIDSWPQALAIQARLQNLPVTLPLCANTADIIWHAAGDTATDLSWYSKRALLMGVYGASELYMINDCSPGFADTWAQLERRIDDALKLGRAVGDSEFLFVVVPP